MSEFKLPDPILFESTLSNTQDRELREHKTRISIVSKRFIKALNSRVRDHDNDKRDPVTYPVNMKEETRDQRHKTLNDHHLEYFVHNWNSLTILQLTEICCDIVAEAEMQRVDPKQYMDNRCKVLGVPDNIRNLLSNSIDDIFTKQR